MTETIWLMERQFINDDASNFRFKLELMHGLRDGIPASWGSISVMPKKSEYTSIANFAVRIGERQSYNEKYIPEFKDTLAADAHIRQQGMKLDIPIDTTRKDFDYSHAPADILERLTDNLSLKNMKLNDSSVATIYQFFATNLTPEAQTTAKNAYSRTGGKQQDNGIKGK